MEKEIKKLEGIFSSIQKYFYFLPINQSKVVFQDIKHQNFDNWLFVIQLEKFRIRIYSDRGEVFLSVGPVWAHPGWEGGPWFDIEVVIAYLTQYEAFIGKYQGKLRNVEEQIARLADFLRQYQDKIANLYSDEEFHKHSHGLELAYNRVVDRYLQSYKNSE